MKIVKGVVKVVGLIATVLSFIPGPHQPIAAAVAAVASVVSVALEVAAPTKARSSARGSLAEYRLDPNTGIPYMMGRTQYAGTGIKRETWGKDNLYQGFTSVYSLGPIDAIEQFTADRTAISFDAGGNAVGALSNRMWMVSQLGLCPSPPFDQPATFTNYPGWGSGASARKLSGLAASHWFMKYDKDGEYYTGGPPTPGIVGRGVKVYDPRLDSTFPGGSGTCRATQESTYVYSNTPHLHALTYALGRWQNGKRRFGIGFPTDAIDISYFANAANVDEANNWDISGVIFSNDGKWNCLKMIMEAGGGEPITLGGRLSGKQSAPRVSIATITSKDIAGRCSVVGTQGQRERINGVVPRYRSESHGWEMVSGDTVRIASYVTADGGRLRTRELEWTLVDKVKQASQLSSYYIMNSREFGPIELTLKIRWVGLKPGDCVTLNIPEMNLNSQKAIVLNRAFDVASGAVSITFVSETDGKHAASLALNGTAPPVASLTYNADAKPAAPGAGSWVLTVGALASASGTNPSLRFNGSVDNATAEQVEFSYRKVGTTEWFITALGPPSTVRADEAAVEPGAQYEGRVRYVAGGKYSLPLVIGPTTVEAAVAGTAVIANSIVGQGPGATATGPNVLNEYVPAGDANRVRYSLFESGALGWAIRYNPSGLVFSSSGWAEGSGRRFFFANTTFTANNQQFSIGTTDLFPVRPLERLFVSALLANSNPGGAGYSFAFHIVFYDGAGAIIPTSVEIASATGSVGSFTRYGAFIEVPWNAYKAHLELFSRNNSGAGGGAAAAYMSEPMVVSASPSQTVWPAFAPGPSNESGSDVTSIVEGPTSSVFKYDYTGTVPEAGEFTRNLQYKLSTLLGYATATWTYTVKTGTVNGLTSANGPQAMSGTTVGTFAVASLGSDIATVTIKASYNGIVRPFEVELTKSKAAAPVGGGGGGGGGSTIASKTSGFTSISGTGWTDITGAITGTLPGGDTTATVSFSLSASPGSGGTNGSWGVEAKLMRDVSGTPTDIGDLATGTSSKQTYVDPPETAVDPASLNETHPDTVGAGSTNTWRVYARVASGGTRTHTITGSVTVVA